MREKEEKSTWVIYIVEGSSDMAARGGFCGGVEEEREVRRLDSKTESRQFWGRKRRTCGESGGGGWEWGAGDAWDRADEARGGGYGGCHQQLEQGDRPNRWAPPIGDPQGEREGRWLLGHGHVPAQLSSRVRARLGKKVGRKQATAKRRGKKSLTNNLILIIDFKLLKLFSLL